MWHGSGPCFPGHLPSKDSERRSCSHSSQWSAPGWTVSSSGAEQGQLLWVRTRENTEKRWQSLRQTVAFEKSVFCRALRLFCLSEVGKTQTKEIQSHFHPTSCHVSVPKQLGAFRFSVVCRTVLPGQRCSNPSVITVWEHVMYVLRAWLVGKFRLRRSVRSIAKSKTSFMTEPFSLSSVPLVLGPSSPTVGL